MKFILFMSTDNSAFEENPACEVSRILAEISEKIESGNDLPTFFQTIRDINGNDIGRYALKPDDYKLGG